jgi:hypothetical protein
MDEAEIIARLNQIADIETQLDQMQLQKLALLSEVTVPEDVQSLVQSGMKAMADVDVMFASELQSYRDEEAAEIASIRNDAALELADVVIPPEVAELLKSIDAKRAAIQTEANRRIAEAQAERSGKENEIDNRIMAMKDRIRLSTEAETRAVFDAVEQRKRDIEAEFKGQEDAAQKLIDQLKEEARTGVKALKFTVTGEHTNGHGKRWQAVFGKGKKTWKPDRLEAYTENHPDIKDCYTVGDPSVSLKAI